MLKSLIKFLQRFEKVNLDKSEYPKWLYHRIYQEILVNSKEEHSQYGRDWQESPQGFNHDS